MRKHPYLAMAMIVSIVLVGVGLAMAQEAPSREGFAQAGLNIRKEEIMNGDNQFLGIVQNGEFQLLLPDPGPLGRSVRLTSIAMQEARPPESGELDLSAYEGSAIMVHGHDGGGWIYSARVIEQAGPILTAVVQHIFAPESEAKSGN